MVALRRIGTIIGYEWRRGLAKKKVLALIILAISFQTLVMVAIYSARAYIGSGNQSFVWIYGLLFGQSFFFVQLIAIVIAGGSMSEEYEHGTADVLLSKPITRVEYLFGKFLGGFFLLAIVDALITCSGIVLSLAFFGGQSGLQFAPLLFLAIAYASLIFFCLSFMFSEVFRGTTLAILLAFTVLIASSIVSPILDFIYGTGSRALPTWAATNFPSLVMSQLMTAPNTIPTSDIGALAQASLIIAVYAIVFILIAAFRLLKSDITKKTA
jgi:ABC-2 type transport system permease protein